MANSFRLQANEDESAVAGGLDSMADAIPESDRDDERDPRAPQHGAKNYEDSEQRNKRASHCPTKLRREWFH